MAMANSIIEKVNNKDTWINGGFFAIKREIKEEMVEEAETKKLLGAS